MTEMTDADVFGAPKEMSDADVFGKPAAPTYENVSEAIPEAFLDRLRAGQALSRIIAAAGHEAKEGAAGQTPTGYSDERLAHMIEHGVFHDPLKSRPGPIQMANEAVMLPAAQIWQSITSTINAGIHGAGGAMGQIVEEFGGSQGTANRAKNEVINAGNWAMIEGGMGRFSRPAVEPGVGVTERAVGGLPVEADFVNAGKVLAPRETVSQAAIRVDGKVYTGTLHSDAFEAASKELGREVENHGEGGFVTSSGRYVSRSEAMKIAESAEQPIADTGKTGEASRELSAEQLQVSDNLKRMWKEDGITPAEAVHDAQTDAFLRHDIVSPAGTETADAVLQRMARKYGDETDLAAWSEADKKTYFDAVDRSAREAEKRLPPEMFGEKPAGVSLADQAKAEGFDAATEYWHGTTHGKFTEFRESTLDNDVLGPAIYLGATKDLADFYGPGRGGDMLGPFWVRGNVATEKTMVPWDPDRYPGKMVTADKVVGNLKLQLESGRREAWGKDMTPVEYAREFMKRRGIDAYNSGFEVAVYDPKNIRAGFSIRDDVLVGGYPMPKADFEALAETGGVPRSLGAAVNDLPPEVPLSVQPARPPGSLTASVKAAADTLLDIGRDAQMLVAPMARGTADSMAIAKDFANSMRRNRWDWDRIDTDIAKRFTPEQRARMWSAADEESVSLQLKEPGHMREHQGLATLEPAERAAVEDLHTRAQNAWARAGDVGLVEGEGLPAYTPRMVINTAGASSQEAALALNSIGGNLKAKTANMLKRKYLEAQDTEAAAKAKYGDQAALARDIRVLPMATAHLEDAIAGRTLINNIRDYGKNTGTDTVVEGAIPAGSDVKWFTLDHPAFKTWRPKLGEVDGKVQALKDAEGNAIFEQVPLYVHGDFEGPLRAVLTQKSGAVYGGMMALKGKTMSLIMNSPMIHNAVEWGRAVFAMPGKVATFKVYFEGNRAKHDVALMHEAIDNGLVPIGHRFFNQDISGLMESPDLTPGRSLTSKVLAAVPGLFDEAAGVAVKRSIDKAGDFWHNTLLWDRVADLQMGLYTNFRADMMAKGIDQQTSSRIAAHWANRYAGALPKEAMSDGATKMANMLLFSRSFTLGNMGVLKDMMTGLPKDVLAQIERDAGFKAGSIEAGVEAGQQAASAAKTLARRKAISVVALDIAGMYVFNSILQNATNVILGDSTVEKELFGYASRLKNALSETAEHPLKLLQPFHFLESLSSTGENEPGRAEKVRIGYAKDGTAIYGRAPVGKIGEEFIGYMTGPLDMMRKKLSTVARPGWQIMSNDAGFGRKVYDPDADTPGKYMQNAYLIAKHMALAQTPEGQVGAFRDLVKGDGDAKVNALQAFGPFAGVTFSKGAPGGPAVGEMYASKSQQDFRVNQALPDIRKQIQRGDIAGAMDRMTELDMPAGLQRFYVKTTLDPALRLSPRATRDFYLHSTPAQRDRFERALQASPPPQ